MEERERCMKYHILAGFAFLAFLVTGICVGLSPKTEVVKKESEDRMEKVWKNHQENERLALEAKNKEEEKKIEYLHLRGRIINIEHWTRNGEVLLTLFTINTGKENVKIFLYARVENLTAIVFDSRIYELVYSGKWLQKIEEVKDIMDGQS